MNKVYLIHLEFTNGWEQKYQTRVALTYEKAKETLKQWAEDEMCNSWIGDYIESGLNEEQLDNHEFTDTYFDALFGELRTTIWIEEKEIEE